MMKLSTWFSIVIILSQIGENIKAQTERSNNITIRECIERAQQSSYMLESDKYRLNAAQKQFQFERSRSLPQISGELAHEQRYLSPYNFHQQWALVHSDWSLGDFLLNTAGAAKQNVLMMKAQQKVTQLDVSRRAAVLYMNILQKQTQTDLLQKRLELLRAHYEVAQALWQSGTRTQFDVLQTESEISLLQEQVAVLDIDRENRWQELALLMNWKDSEFPGFSPINTAEICRQPLPQWNEAMIASVRPKAKATKGV